MVHVRRLSGATEDNTTPQSVVSLGLHDPDVSLEGVIAFQFQPLIDRMVDKFGWSEDVAVQVFEDTKRFLYLCGVSTDGPLSPSPQIDEVWHNFILFTEDYYQFCKRCFGRFIHHRPRRRDDPEPTRSLVRDTLNIAQATFGTLSSSWDYEKLDGSRIEANSGCDTNCNGHCSPSTNCQDSD